MIQFPCDIRTFEKFPDGEVFFSVISDNGMLLPWAKEPGTSGFVRLAAVKTGGSKLDWAIYYGPLRWALSKVSGVGLKVIDPELIREIFPCTDEVFNLYRY